MGYGYIISDDGAYATRRSENFRDFSANVNNILDQLSFVLNVAIIYSDVPLDEADIKLHGDKLRALKRMNEFNEMPKFIGGSDV